ncbi:MAG: twin-arginine translocation signal domain-containing protein [Chloroflexi bacterium]|nr:MAG: twin-arginine translocation signal domain-containing protein [Chloroflexota bacterium]
MKQLDRRQFLGMAAAGSAVALASAAVPMSGILTWTGERALTFRAVAGLPKHPLPVYASFVVEGAVNLDRGTGTVTKSLFAGAPEAMSTILFPGTVRSIRVTGVQRSGDTVKIAGVVVGQPTLGPREKGIVSIVINQAEKTAHADFLGTAVRLRVQ